MDCALLGRIQLLSPTYIEDVGRVGESPSSKYKKMSGLDVRDQEAEALSTLPRPPLIDGSLGGDPSAGSPTDTLFTCSPCRHGAWTVSSSDAPCVGARRAVSEGSDVFNRPSLRIVRTSRLLPRLGTRGSSEFPAYSQVCSGSLRIRSRNTVYDLALLAEPRF